MFSIEINNHLSLKKNIANGISDEELQDAKKIAQNSFKKVLAEKDDIALLSVCDNMEQVNLAKKIADEISNKYKKLIIFAIGGSSLGGQALCGSKFYQYFSKSIKTEIVFIDNLHSHNFDIFLNDLNYCETAFLTISKSGGTIETLSQILISLDFFKTHIKKYGANNFYFITEDAANPIKKIAESLDRNIIEHHKKIGGRYSCFTAVSMIPAYLSGFNLENYVLGGKNIIDDFLQNKNNMVIEGATLLYAVLQKGISNHVFIPYLQRLYQSVYWYAQLFAESLGKDGIGMTPIKALGSVDQHSQLQLYLEGPKDKFFTFITQNTENRGNKIFVPKKIRDQVDFLHNNSLGDVITANQNATIRTLAEHGSLSREVRFKEFSDKAVGEFLMYFMLETILLGYMLNIDPFSQPSVEIGKNKAKDILRRK